MPGPEAFTVGDGPREILVEVAYAKPEVQRIVQLRVPEGTTLMEAVVRSGIVDQFPEIDLERGDFGIFGKLERRHDRVLRERDRVEIYRPLRANPKVQRAERARARQAPD